MPASNPALPRRRRRRPMAVLMKPLLLILVIFCMVLGISVFFQVSEVRVTGNTYYSDEEIIEASGIEEGGNLIFISGAAIKLRLMGQLAYVDDVSISRRAPATVVIGVSESSPVAAVESNGSWYVLGKNCKILEKTDAEGAAHLIEVTGVTAIRPSVGDKLAVGSTDALKLEYLSELLGQFMRLEMETQVTRVDLSAPTNVTFEYMDRFNVQLGKRQRLEYKLELLETVIASKSQGERGTIELSNEGVAHFIPE